MFVFEEFLQLYEDTLVFFDFINDILFFITQLRDICIQSLTILVLLLDFVLLTVNMLGLLSLNH